MKTETPRSKKLCLQIGRPCRLNFCAIQLLFALVLLLSFAGCSTTTDIRPYPSSFPPIATTPAGQCPQIAGLYANDGYVSTPPLTCNPPLKASWNCDGTLSGNLVKMKSIEWSELHQVRMVDWVKIEQPDNDTLEVSFPPRTHLEARTFKRSQGDFDCDSSGLRFSMTGLLLSDEHLPTSMSVLMSAFGLLSASGGVASTERVFRPLQDGSLSMEVTDSKAAVLMGIYAGRKKFNAFVRWVRDSRPLGSGLDVKPDLHLPAGDIKPFQTLDGKPGYSISCVRGGELAPCSQKAYEEASTLCGAIGYSVVSTTNREGASIQNDAFTLVVRCKY